MAKYTLEGLGWGSGDKDITVSELEAEFFSYYPNRDRSDFFHFLAKINSGSVEHLASCRVWRKQTAEVKEGIVKEAGCQHKRKYTNTAYGKSFVVCPDCKQEVS